MCGGIALLMQPAVLVKSWLLKLKLGIKTNHPMKPETSFVAIGNATMPEILSLAGQLES
jgi:hypothetical protein